MPHSEKTTNPVFEAIQPSKLYARASSKLEPTSGYLRDGEALSELEKFLAPSKLVL